MAEETRTDFPPKSGLSQGKKTALIFLIVFSLLALGLGVLKIRNVLYAPFALNDAIPGSLNEQVDTVTTLHYRDTDGDGLNDFDELYVYNTSPYLADTDSDGLKDKQEVQSGTNPLCAEGRDCAAALSSAAPATSTPVIGGIYPESFFYSLSDPAELRRLLKSYGIADNVLNGVSDKELLKMVGELVSASTTLQKQIQNNLAPAGQ